MGYSMRTDRYRYTEWHIYDHITYTPYNIDTIESQYHPAELYDHTNDPDENRNVVDDPHYADIVKMLHEQLKAGWRGALPKSMK